ncbi:MAG: hypothetical protein ACI8X5_002178 [Planctomycetota bacterium]|jgi:hypothetical protein
MITSVLLTCLAAPSAPAPLAPTLPALIVVQDVDSEKEITAAGEDVAKLLELAKTWKADKKTAASKAAFKRVVELDPENEPAHKGLRHPRYDNKWFESYSAMSKYKREETKRMAEQGLSKYGDEWVPEVDVNFMKMGWAKSEAGGWVDPYYIRVAEHERAMLGEGRELRKEDSTWVSKDELGKWQEGLWKCGEEWVDTETANAYHSNVGTWWQAQGERFDLLATCSMDTLLWARWHADLCFPDLVRLYGLQPTTRPTVVVFKNIEQFNLFAAGEQGKFQPSESSGFSSLHHAYFADSWVDMSSTPPRFLGTGVAYWDATDESVAPFGKHSVRHATGIAYAEAIAPSLKTLGTAISTQSLPDQGTFWSEKPVPRWLYYGGAAYVERYYKDKDAEDPMWPRAWSIENLLKGGELDSLETIFAFNLSLETIPASGRLINEAGLVVSFILDGNCGPVIEAHRAYKSALEKGEGAPEAMAALQAAVIANKADFTKYVASV